MWSTAAPPSRRSSRRSARAPRSARRSTFSSSASPHEPSRSRLVSLGQLCAGGASAMTARAPARITFDEFVCSWTPLMSQWSLARYRNTVKLGRSQAGLYHIANDDGQQDLWLLRPSGERARLTDLGERVARWFVVEPAGSVILAADRFGDENHQLYRVMPDGRMSDLVVREGVQHHLRARSLSRDGLLLAYSANLRDR